MSLVTFTASFLIWVMFLGLFVLWVIDGRVKKSLTLHALFASGLSWVVTETVKTFFPTTRPFVANGKEVMTLTVPDGSSFPSSHAAVVFALAVTVFLHDRKLGSLFLIGAILVGAGRIAANVHYFADVVAGAVVGSLVAVGVRKIHFFKVADRY